MPRRSKQILGTWVSGLGFSGGNSSYKELHVIFLTWTVRLVWEFPFRTTP